MELLIKGKNVEVPESVRSYIEKKLGKLDRYLDHLAEVEVEVAEEKTKSHGGRSVIQVTARVNGTILRAEERNADVRSAVDAVAHVIEQQIKRFKGKQSQRGRPGPTIRTGEPATEGFDEAEGGAEEYGRLVKVKRFSLKPMDPEEATEQMDLLGHTFFLFLNSESGQYGVVYRRGDGHYGLIEPELT